MPNPKLLIYKGFPLRRVGNMIYYGCIADGYMVQINILKTKTEADLEMPTEIKVQLQNTAPGVSRADSIVKDVTKSSLYEAIDIGEAWLRKALTDSAQL